MTRPLATAGRFTIYSVAPTVWAIYKGETFTHNARRTDAARYGVPFTKAGAATYARQLDEADRAAADDARTARRLKVAAGVTKAAARVDQAARSPALPL